MFKKLMFLVVAQGLTVAGGFSVANAADNCLLADRQQQSLILSEGPKALRDESTNECFDGLVKDELAVLSEGQSPLAGDSDFVIQSLMQAALVRSSFDRTSAE